MILWKLRRECSRVCGVVDARRDLLLRKMTKKSRTSPVHKISTPQGRKAPCRVSPRVPVAVCCPPRLWCADFCLCSRPLVTMKKWWGEKKAKAKDDDDDRSSDEDGSGDEKPEKAAAAAAASNGSPADKKAPAPKTSDAASPAATTPTAAGAAAPAGGASSSSASDRDRRTSFAAALSERLDIEMQMAGSLWKKDTAGSSSWKERYFILKDGYLLYYTEPKSSMMVFDMHPKGIVPLERVEVETVKAGPNKAMQSALRISHRSFGTKSVLLCAKDDTERDEWMAAIIASRDITYARSLDSKAMVETLKRQMVEASNKLAAASGATFKSTEQTTQLAAVNRALLTAIQRAEAAHGIRIPVDYSAGEAAAAAPDAAPTTVMYAAQDGAVSQSLPPPPPPPAEEALAPPPAPPRREAVAVSATESATPTDASVTLPPPPPMEEAATSLPPPPPPMDLSPPPAAEAMLPPPPATQGVPLPVRKPKAPAAVLQAQAASAAAAAAATLPPPPAVSLPPPPPLPQN